MVLLNSMKQTHCKILLSVLLLFLLLGGIGCTSRPPALSDCAPLPPTGWLTLSGGQNSWRLSLPPAWIPKQIGKGYPAQYSVMLPGERGGRMFIIIRQRPNNTSLSTFYHMILDNSQIPKRRFYLREREVVSYWAEGEAAGWIYLIEAADWFAEFDESNVPTATFSQDILDIISSFGRDCG